jgi:hypothetical protein
MMISYGEKRRETGAADTAGNPGRLVFGAAASDRTTAIALN